jgi:hypothetical protein
MMSRHSPEGAIANILWKVWEESLPNTPYQMALVIAQKLREEGYLKVNDDPSAAQGRESAPLPSHLSGC